MIHPGIYKRGEIEYDRIEAVNISSLLWMAKSAKHYKARPRVQTKALSLGTASHAAVLEPDRFASDFAIWDRRGDSGKLAPRNGQHWESFCALNRGKEIITATEHQAALDIASAIRNEPQCAAALESGEPEVSIVWYHERTGFWLKGRVDWLDIDAHRARYLDLKTAADITPSVFMPKAAKLHYHTRMAFYHDGIKAASGMSENELLETDILAVESGKPHDCVLYWMEEEVLEIGRTEYEDLLTRLRIATDNDDWNGIGNGAKMRYFLPRWAYDDPEEESDNDLNWSKDT